MLSGFGLGLGITVAVLVSCSGGSGGSGETRTAQAVETTGATPSTEEPAGRGGVRETVRPEPGVVADPVGIDEVAEFGNGVRARVGAIESLQAEGHLPGEHSGPAVALSVEVTNGSSRPINLDTVTVDLRIRDGVSAYGVAVPARPPLAGDVPPGETASGEYVFTLPPQERTDVQLRVKYSADTPTVVFAGSVAGG